MSHEFQDYQKTLKIVARDQRTNETKTLFEDEVDSLSFNMDDGKMSFFAIRSCFFEKIDFSIDLKDVRTYIFSLDTITVLKMDGDYIDISCWVSE